MAYIPHASVVPAAREFARTLVWLRHISLFLVSERECAMDIYVKFWTEFINSSIHNKIQKALYIQYLSVMKLNCFVFVNLLSMQGKIQAFFLFYRCYCVNSEGKRLFGEAPFTHQDNINCSECREMPEAVHN